MHSGVVGLWTCIYGYLCMLFPCPIIIRQLLFGQKATGSWTNAPVLLNWKGGVFHCPRRVKPMGMGQNMGLTQDKQLKSALWRVNIGPQTDAIKLSPAVRSSTHGMRAAQDPSDLVGNFQRSPRQNDDGTCYTNHLLAVSFSLTFKLYLWWWTPSCRFSLTRLTAPTAKGLCLKFLNHSLISGLTELDCALVGS
jgi:hypothetical protein